MNAGRLALAAVVGALVLTAAATSAPVPAAPLFRVRPDLRMCPSPTCGGFWVARANRATTVCAGGAARAWCYVAEITLPKPAASRGELLARGRIVHLGAGETGPADRFVATATWLAATHASATGSVYLVSDNGIRCVRAPCFTLRATTVNTPRATTASALDLAGVGATALDQRAQAALFKGGLLVAGTIRRDADGGRTIVASQFFLAAG